MNKVLDFLNWHKKEYGHAYNHQNDLIETAKKSTLYAEYYHKAEMKRKIDRINNITQPSFSEILNELKQQI